MNENTIILVIYIAVHDMSDDEVSSYVSRMKQKIKDDTTGNNSFLFFVPIRTGQTRIECINPQYLSKKDYELKTSKIIIDLETQVSEYLGKSKRKSRVIPKVPPSEREKLNEGLDKSKSIKVGNVTEKIYNTPLDKSKVLPPPKVRSTPLKESKTKGNIKPTTNNRLQAGPPPVPTTKKKK